MLKDVAQVSSRRRFLNHVVMEILTFTGAQQFECPSDNGFFPDSIQCDKYYECQNGVAKEQLCADGLVFDGSIKRINKCDQLFNVDCGDRTELRNLFQLSN